MARTTRPAAQGTARQRKDQTAAKLDALIEEATVDAHDESEQTSGFYTMLEDHLAIPFTEGLGVDRCLSPMGPLEIAFAPRR